VELGVLGPVVIRESGTTLTVSATKQRTLLCLLLVSHGRPVLPARLIDELWGERPPPTAASALQVHTSGLRKLFGDRLRWSAAGYELDLAKLRLDTARFDDAIRDARAVRTDDRQRAVNKYRAALDLWRGEPFAGTAETPMLRAERERLTQLRLAAAEELYDLELAAGRHAEVLEELASIAKEYPTRERLVSELMLALHRSGRLAAAEGAYKMIRHALKDHVDAEPSERLQALAAAIRHNDPALDIAPPSVPTPASRFVGRRWELDRIGQLLGKSRLVTLIGPGGSGKTRMAVQLCVELSAQHPDGVHWVDVADATNGEQVIARLQLLANALGSNQQSGLEAITKRLHSKRALVVLDNCEHLVSECRALVSELTAQCAGVRILATSRTALTVQGETTWPVFGLAIPTGNSARAALARSDAVRLLALRGAAARPGFIIDETNISAAATLCRRLDGLPLAIELVAARLRAMSLSELVTRLDTTIDIAGPSSPARRYQTMREALDWSFALLDPDERTLFRRLAIFPGSWTLSAAERVGADADGLAPNSATEVVDTLLRLVERSMVVASPPSTTAGETRFGMLETTREYALGLLIESCEHTSTTARHVEWVTHGPRPRFGSSGLLAATTV